MATIIVAIRYKIRCGPPGQQTSMTTVVKSESTPEYWSTAPSPNCTRVRGVGDAGFAICYLLFICYLLPSDKIVRYGRHPRDCQRRAIYRILCYQACPSRGARPGSTRESTQTKSHCGQ